MTSASASDAVPPASRPRVPERRQPGPFPVVIVRPATVTVPAYLREHRECRRGANELAAALTAQCHAGRPVGPDTGDEFWLDLNDPRRSLDVLPDRQVVDDVIRQAPMVAAAPPPGTVRVGRDRQRRPVVVLLHGPHWSLVLRRGHPEPAAWALFGATGPQAFRCYGTCERSVDWDDMTRAVYRLLTAAAG